MEKESKVLLVGETWMSAATHYKGFDDFRSTTFHSGAGPLLAWYCFRNRNRYDVLLTDGEQVGIPLALLTRVFGRGGAAHVMIVHILSVPKKAKLIRALRLAGQVDRYVVYCSKQGEFIREELGVAAERVVLSTFMVDTDFFAPVAPPHTGRPVISSAGLERRDYPTLMDAVDGLERVEVVVGDIEAEALQGLKGLAVDVEDLLDAVETDLRLHAFSCQAVRWSSSRRIIRSISRPSVPMVIRLTKIVGRS